MAVAPPPRGLSRVAAAADLGIGEPPRRVHAVAPAVRVAGGGVGALFLEQAVPLRQPVQRLLGVQAELREERASAEAREAAPPRAIRLGTATVTIVQGERIDPVILENMSPLPDRQVRRRGEMPLVEFY